MFLVSSTLTSRLRPYAANALIYAFACLAVGSGVFIVLGLLSGGLGILVLLGSIPLALLFSIPGGILSVALAPRITGAGRLRATAGGVSFASMGLVMWIVLSWTTAGTHEIDPRPIAVMFAIYAGLVGLAFAWIVLGFRSASQRAEAAIHEPAATTALGYRSRRTCRSSGRRGPSKHNSTR